MPGVRREGVGRAVDNRGHRVQGRMEGKERTEDSKHRFQVCRGA